MRNTRRGACVCGCGVRERRPHRGPKSEPQDGGASPRRGPGSRPRPFRYSTTTNYTLKLDSSSKGRECYFNVTYSGGGRRV